MTLPPRYLNAVIVSITRPTKDGYGGDRTGSTVILAGPIRCNRQTKIERNFGTVLTRFDSTGPAEFTDAAFYLAIPKKPTKIQVEDVITWQRCAADGTLGPEITGSEIRRIDINDGLLGASRSNMRLFTRGGDGSGA